MAEAPSPHDYIGRPVKRLEDRRLVTGQGRYAADIRFDGLTHLALLRSPLPHARIVSIDTQAASEMPGVLAVWTAADLGSAAVMRTEPQRGVVTHDRPVLAEREVNYVGEGIAAVIAEDPYIAQDAAQSIFADLEPLPGSGDVLTAAAEGAPTVHSNMPSNLTGDRVRSYGDIEAAFAGDIVSVKRRLTTSRVAGASMEPRGITAAWDEERQTLALWTSTQSVFGVREAVAEALELEPESVRVVAEDVGGGFGEKGPAYPEEILVALAARRLGRPVRWIATRSEHTATTFHGHGTVLDLELAAERSGKLRGLRGRVLHDLGAYVGAAAGQPNIISSHMISAYVIPAMHIEQHVVYTNAVPGGYIRGGGRPIGNYAMERMMDALADQLGIDRVELRRRNLIQPTQMPYDTHYPGGGGQTTIYDSGDYPAMLEAVVEAIGRDSRAHAEDGRLVGSSVVCCVESTGFGGEEPARVRIEPDGRVRVFVGSTPQGQSHLTFVAQVAAERLGLPIERFEITAADTQWVPDAAVTAGSRSAVQVGNAAAKAAASARQQLLEHAAEHLHVYPSDVDLSDGNAQVRGVPESALPLTGVIPADGIDVLELFDPDLPSAFSSGCHAATVAVDPETGHIDVLRYVIACDNGRSINPMVVEGQLQGGFAHGIGYALYEEAVYQPDGNFVSSSFLDYTIVGAPEMRTLPQLVKLESNTPANPEGFKGVGESGTIPVPAAIASAVESALRLKAPGATITHIPITPLRVHELLS